MIFHVTNIKWSRKRRDKRIPGCRCQAPLELYVHAPESITDWIELQDFLTDEVCDSSNFLLDDYDVTPSVMEMAAFHEFRKTFDPAKALQEGWIRTDGGLTP